SGAISPPVRGLTSHSGLHWPPSPMAGAPLGSSYPSSVLPASYPLVDHRAPRGSTDTGRDAWARVDDRNAGPIPAPLRSQRNTRTSAGPSGGVGLLGRRPQPPRDPVVRQTGMSAPPMLSGWGRSRLQPAEPPADRTQGFPRTFYPGITPFVSSAGWFAWP